MYVDTQAQAQAQATQPHTLDPGTNNGSLNDTTTHYRLKIEA
jgi:hypothetical protein